VHVRNLIRDRIRSIEQLETLLLIRMEPARIWKLKEISDALRCTDSVAESAIATLCRSGLAEPKDSPQGRGHRYAPESAEIDAHVRELADTYQNYRVETLVFISSNAINRVRSQALNTFAEAFRLRGPKKDG
jgi:hypothetical protein